MPLYVRFSVDNVILASISVGYEKPNIDLFFNPIVMQLKKLELGINISIEDIYRDTKFFCIACCCDKPARSALLNMISCTGFFGCTKCFQNPISFKTSELREFHNQVDQNHLQLNKDTHDEDETQKQSKHDGSVRLYLFTDEWKNLRTKNKYDEDLKKVIANINDRITDPYVNGIKGPCILKSLKYFHPIRSTCIDYMHSVLEGVIKNFFKYWFASEFSKRSFSLRKYMKEIEIRLSRIKPPTFVPSTPRKLDSWNLWSAHEYLSFILYYSLPVFKDIMSHEHYENLKKLVLFLETILAERINLERLKKV